MADAVAEAEAKAAVGTIWGDFHTIVSSSCCACCVSGDVISSNIEKGDALVIFDCSLVL